MISFDTSFFQTLLPFLFKPGFLSREFLEGRRKRYMSPVRLYIFMSIVFFFFARISNDKIPNEDRQLNFIVGSDTTATVVPGDSIFSNYALSDSMAFDSKQYDRSEKLQLAIEKAKDNPSLYLNQYLTNISYALFLLMPIFALLLQLFYIRRKRFYVEHLIFAVNIHSFVLLILTIIVIINMLFDRTDLISGILILIIPLYFVTGMKRFYAQSIGKIILKTILLGSMYTILMGGTITGLALLTLYRM